ncbi:MAG: hypothetical protein HC771_15870 [Synechococcales cyanobacterium CRU_2_2]|nr:hypothetical protein [Synechococcales cyanobacterium CRU_2_2]
MPSPAVRCSRYFVWFYTVTIVIATLAPFRFQLSALADLSDNWRIFWNGRTYLGDFTSNILLFMPLGWELWLMRSKATQAQVPPLGLSLMLSATVEGLQLLLPGRTSSLTDVVANTLGGGLGALLSAGFATWPWPWLRSRRSQCQGLALLLTLWLLLGLGTTNQLNQSAQLSNWDPSYSIHLGQGGRDHQPWFGELLEVAIADRALSPQRMQTLEKHNLPTQPPVSQTPPVPLRFHYQAGKTLIPLTPAALKASLEQTSAFTLDLRFSTQTLDGEAALFAFALDPWHSNWMVLRDRQDLQVQLRSPLTGTYHHRSLYLTIPELFQDTRSHRLTLTYGANLLQVYWDGRRRSPALSLNADTTFWHCFLPLKFSRYRLTPWGGAIAQGLFYAFWLLPLGWMLGALEHQSSQKINGMLGARLVAVGLVGGWLLLLRPAQPFPWHLWLWGWGMLEGGRWRYHASLARESRCRS